MLEPGVAVREAPGQDGFDGFVWKDGGEERAIEVGDLTVAFGDVGGHELVVGVEFGDEDLQIELFDFI